MSAGLIEAGVSLDHARRIIFDAAAGRDGTIRTDASHEGGQVQVPGAKPMIGMTEATGAYDRLNKATARAA